MGGVLKGSLGGRNGMEDNGVLRAGDSQLRQAGSSWRGCAQGGVEAFPLHWGVAGSQGTRRNICTRYSRMQSHKR